MSEFPRVRSGTARFGLFAGLARIVPGRSAAERGDASRLIEEALRGDAESQAALRARLEPVIRTRARTFLARRVARRIGVHDADDLLQQVWVALFRDGGAMLRAYDPERGMGLEGYVAMITHREIWHAAERAAAQKREAEGAAIEAPDSAVCEGASPERIVATREVLAGVDAFVRAKLSERARQAYTLLYAEGRTVDEVATLLGTNEQTIYNFQHEIRRHARVFMARYEDGASAPR
jgi:RNA polymerase sigma factor (sigma-70 family)